LQTGGPLAEKLGIAGYYVRIAPSGAADDEQNLNARIAIPNRAGSSLPASQQVGMDFLQLVRYGL
jgi:glucoamylase